MNNVEGTPGYIPSHRPWRDGSTKWDSWAFGAIILEADLPLDAYYKTDREEAAIVIAKKHIKD